MGGNRFKLEFELHSRLYRCVCEKRTSFCKVANELEWEYKCIYENNTILKGFYYKFILPILKIETKSYLDHDIIKPQNMLHYDKSYNAYYINNINGSGDSYVEISCSNYHTPRGDSEIYGNESKTLINTIREHQVNDLCMFYKKLALILEKFSHIPEMKEFLHIVIY